MMRKDLTQGGVWRNVTTFLLPYILAYFLQILYGLADLFVIGRYCDVDSTTAVSNGAQVMYFVTCVVIGLAMGTTVNTAHAIGAKDYRRALRVIGTTATMFLSLSVVLACALLCFRHAIVGWVGTLYPMGFTTLLGSLFSVFICLVVYRWMVRHKKLAPSAS